MCLYKNLHFCWQYFAILVACTESILRCWGTFGAIRAWFSLFVDRLVFGITSRSIVANQTLSIGKMNFKMTAHIDKTIYYLVLHYMYIDKAYSFNPATVVTKFDEPASNFLSFWPHFLCVMTDHSSSSSLEHIVRIRLNCFGGNVINLKLRIFDVEFEFSSF